MSFARLHMRYSWAVTQPYIDEVPVRGPASRYVLPSGEEEQIPENSGIRCFVWEHFQDLNRVCQRMKYSGGTFSGFKSSLCAAEIELLGQRCTSEGRLPNEHRVAKVKNWGPCPDLSDVWAFIGTIGVCKMFIRNFAHRGVVARTFVNNPSAFVDRPLCTEPRILLQ